MGKMGLLTIVDDDVIEIEYIVDWFLKAREKYGLEKVIADNYRTDIVRRAFEDAGIKLEVLRNPKSNTWITCTTYRYNVCET